VAYLYDALNRQIAETIGTSVISGTAVCFAGGAAMAPP